MYKSFFKRMLELIIALAGLIITSPLFIIVASLLFIANKGKPLFLQLRPGKNGDLFRIIKFRTMNDKRDEKYNLLPDPQRLTQIGQLVRNTSLDELPQLINVIKGDMSLIGPRPLLREYLPLYTPEQFRRHEVRPGITGWAQINGRNAINWEKKFEYDVWYVDHLSFALDVKIIFKTFQKVFRKEGINQAGQATMNKFEGTLDRLKNA